MATATTYLLSSENTGWDLSNKLLVSHELGKPRALFLQEITYNLKGFLVSLPSRISSNYLLSLHRITSGVPSTDLKDLHPEWFEKDAGIYLKR